MLLLRAERCGRGRGLEEEIELFTRGWIGLRLRNQGGTAGVVGAPQVERVHLRERESFRE